MTHTNAEIAAFLDPNKTRAEWWHKNAHWCITRERWVEIGEPCLSLPNFAKDGTACFKELRPVLLAMGCEILERNESRGTAVKLVDGRCAGFADHYSAAVTAAFSWAMDNQKEALRRACEEVGRG